VPVARASAPSGGNTPARLLGGPTGREARAPDPRRSHRDEVGGSFNGALRAVEAGETSASTGT